MTQVRQTVEKALWESVSRGEQEIFYHLCGLASFAVLWMKHYVAKVQKPVEEIHWLTDFRNRSDVFDIKAHILEIW